MWLLVGIGISALAIAVFWVVNWRQHRQLISNVELNDCKPGAFMTRKEDE